MTDRERLIELIKNADNDKNLGWYDLYDLCRGKGCAEYFADYLLANGVTVQELDRCCRCKDTSEMTVAISNKLVAGVRTGWLGGNLPARYCPFCGRRLPKPPKGE